MTSKEEERKALEQIKKIVSTLGPDSYIATAFEGCFEIAESNIDNDFACSMKQWADRLEGQNKELTKTVAGQKAEIEQLNSTNQSLRQDRDTVSELLVKERKQNAEEINRLNGIIAECRKDSDDKEHQIQDMANQILKLKAQVYDLTF